MSTIDDIEVGCSSCHTHSIASFISQYNVPFHFVGNHDAAGRFVSYFLFTSAKRAFAQLTELSKNMN